MILTLSPVAVTTGEGNLDWPRSSACCRCSLLSSYMRGVVTIKAYQVVRDVGASYDALLDLLEAMEYLNRLNIYTRISPTPAMTEIIVKIMVELLSTLAEVTKQIRQKRPSKSVLTDIPLD